MGGVGRCWHTAVPHHDGNATTGCSTLSSRASTTGLESTNKSGILQGQELGVRLEVMGGEGDSTWALGDSVPTVLWQLRAPRAHTCCPRIWWDITFLSLLHGLQGKEVSRGVPGNTAEHSNHLQPPNKPVGLLQ